MKILLLGKNGQVGWELQRSLSPLGELVALDRRSTEADGGCGDLTQPEALRQTVMRVRPDVIVNAAAYTAVDKAESEPELARTINAVAPGALAPVRCQAPAEARARTTAAAPCHCGTACPASAPVAAARPARR